ncbi:MAG TPA: thiamine pyrophosphate-dependent enzyme [Candidatus Limnocylindria bacterium]|jgi:acetolactate synthase-1/2/3 large subunit|nr:thiamine pyrophosphate-dependent enzyme [Candidatus Limnocylindria bacterium]
MRQQPSVSTETKSGNAVLVETLRRWGVRFFAGVNGGGVVHVAKHLEPYYDLSHSADPASRMLTMGEYVAGFVPLGHWLATGRIAGCVTTTGAATKLGGSGMTDAKLHNIPAVYLIALNSTMSIGNAPLQDVSEYGMNVVPQLQAELGEGLVVIDDMSQIDERLRRAQRVLKHNKPVAIAFHPDVLSHQTDVDVTWTSHPRTFAARDVAAFLEEFPRVAKGRRVVVYVSGEAAFAPKIRTLTTVLSKVLKAPMVWSVNGANAVARDNPYGFGHISFGGNERAMELWRGLTKDDVVIALGFDAGEYSLNLAKIPAGHVYHFTDLRDAYGHKGGEFRHRVAHEYRMVRGDIGLVLEEVLPRLATTCAERPDTPEAPESLNTREPAGNARPGTVDFQEFYERVDRIWRPGSIGFDDVCIAYKDRQWVTQRPNPNIPFWTTHDGSAMGGGFGLGVGAKVANPDLHTFVFTGDGCFRLFGGALADAANLDLRVFIVNNEVYGIVDKGLEVIIPDYDKANYHSKLPHIDFVKAAEAHGWDGVRIAPDLSNLKDVMDAAYEKRGRSMLVDLPVDADQILGLNPRLGNLTTKTYL